MERSATIKKLTTSSLLALSAALLLTAPAPAKEMTSTVSRQDQATGVTAVNTKDYTNAIAVNNTEVRFDALTSVHFNYEETLRDRNYSGKNAIEVGAEYDQRGSTLAVEGDAPLTIATEGLMESALKQIGGSVVDFHPDVVIKGSNHGRHGYFGINYAGNSANAKEKEHLTFHKNLTIEGYKQGIEMTGGHLDVMGATTIRNTAKAIASNNISGQVSDLTFHGPAVIEAEESLIGNRDSHITFKQGLTSTGRIQSDADNIITIHGDAALKGAAGNEQNLMSILGGQVVIAPEKGQAAGKIVTTGDAVFKKGFGNPAAGTLTIEGGAGSKLNSNFYLLSAKADDTAADHKANLHLTLSGANAVWDGALAVAHPAGNADADGAFLPNITLKEGARWAVAPTENIKLSDTDKATGLELSASGKTDLNLEGGLVDLAAHHSAEKPLELSVANLKGKGTFLIGTALDPKKAHTILPSRLNLTGKSEGDFTLDVQDNPSLPVDDYSSAVMIVDKQGDKANHSSKFALKNPEGAELGGFVYTMEPGPKMSSSDKKGDTPEDKNDGHLYLVTDRAKGQPVQPQPDPDKPKPVDPKPNPDQPKPNPDQPKPNPDHPKPNPDQPKPNPDHPKPNPDQPKPNPDQPKPNPDQPKPNPDQPKPVEPELSSTAAASLHSLASFLQIGRAQQTTLDQRMGELRLSEKGFGGWVCVFGGDLSDRLTDWVAPYSLRYKGLQVGADKGLTVSNGMAFWGLSLDLTDGTSRFDKGTGDVKSLRAGLYGSWVSNNGLYLDGSLTYGRDKGTFKVQNLRGKEVKGLNLKARSLTASVEVGKTFDLTELQGGRLTLEPQAQLTFRKTSALDFTADNRLHVHAKPANSLVGRLGAKVAYRPDQAPWNAYATLSAFKEFKGGALVSFNGAKSFMPSHKKDHWFEAGLGVQGRLTSSLSGWFEAGRSFGGSSYEKDWSLTAGLRFDF